jgi:hypothetical protein
MTAVGLSISDYPVTVVRRPFTPIKTSLCLLQVALEPESSIGEPSGKESLKRALSFNLCSGTIIVTLS